MSRITGKCKWFNSKKGYGFITMDNGEDVFVHQSEIHALGFRSLDEGERVELEIILEDNKKKAVRVTGPHGDYVRGANNLRFRNDRSFRRSESNEDNYRHSDRDSYHQNKRY